MALYILMYNVLETERNNSCFWMNNKKYYHNLISSTMSHFCTSFNLAFKRAECFKVYSAITYCNYFRSRRCI
jgi:hypothetical protein